MRAFLEFRYQSKYRFVHNVWPAHHILRNLFGSSDIWSDAALKRRKPQNKLYIWISV